MVCTPFIFHIFAQPYFDRPDAAVAWFFPFRNWLSPGEFGWTDTANKGNNFSNDDWVMSGWIRFWHAFASNKPG